MSSRGLRLAAEGFRHVLAHPLRSALTAATCAVAIAVTVNVISLNYGLDEDIRADLSRFGRLTIDVGRAPVIRPDAPRARFGPEDLESLKKSVEGLSATVVPVRQRPVAVRGATEDKRTSLVAVGHDYLATVQIPLAAGRWLAEGERKGETCVVDRGAVPAFFPGETPAGVLGKTLVIEGIGESRVVGVLDDPLTYRALFDAFDENRKSRTMAGALLAFRNVYVGEDALGTGDLSGVTVALPDEASLEEAGRRISKTYPRVVIENVDGDLPAITSFLRRDWMEALGGKTQSGAFIGNLVWVLIVLVACVMISTMNLITIRERYDEIAVRRCEGARRRDVVAQVTAEGLVTSLVGGLLGLPLGYVGAALLRRLVDFPFRFDPRYAGIAVVVSVALGLLASVVPARRAAALDPAPVLSRRLS
jgi:putative ABC transport system permease protein